MFISILKFTGFFILLLLLLVLLLLVLLLFVPFRYELDGSYIDEVPDGDVRLSWLMHFATVDLSYCKGVLIKGHIRVLGICLYRIEGLQKPASEDITGDGLEDSLDDILSGAGDLSEEVLS